jgi:hypothetical protein
MTPEELESIYKAIHKAYCMLCEHYLAKRETLGLEAAARQTRMLDTLARAMETIAPHLPPIGRPKAAMIFDFSDRQDDSPTTQTQGEE